LILNYQEKIKSCVCNDKRGRSFEKRYFSRNFDDYINKRLIQEFNFNCQLINTSNKFNIVIGKSRKRGELWTGTFRCVSKDCNIRYRASIPQEKNNIVICYNEFGNHPRKEKTVACTGEERFLTSLRVAADGAANVRNENIIYNHENQTKKSNC